MPKTFFLATIDNTSVSMVREFNEENYNQCIEHVKKLNKLSSDEKLFRLVELNYREFKSTVKNYLDKFIDNPTADFSEFEFLFLDLNRLILNFLSSVRTYLDHTETRFKREFGAKSDEILLFKKETGEAYDNYFSYRFLYKLRNFSQHCGLPSGSLKINSEAGDKGKTICTLTIFLVRDDLTSKYDSWGEKVTEDLNKKEETFDIVPLIDEKFELLEKLNTKINAPNYSKHIEYGNKLLSLLLEVTEQRGAPSLICSDIIEEKINMEITWFPYEMISKITGAKINIRKT
ncbi:MAG: hypothetical protein HY959_05855 [Ignavibacteriae bacterium]|nr:hypothetical protein [Ignavibacteriota bacterium]